MNLTRRLAAILAADVVGFSRLMEADEAGTLAALKSRRREVLEPLVAKHQGRVFKVTGDGVLVEFASAVNAVQCAVDLQQAFAAANAELPDERHLILRIAVNLGDVMVEGSDLYGDGVNIAARLEAIADPGGILVSGTTYDYVRNKVKVGFDDLGPQALKNIAEPVRAYRVTGTPAVAAAPKASTDKPSIAVLPFINMSGDPEQEYFSDGITEDIITELSRFRSLFVIARNSSFQFKGKNIDVRRVARELGVHYVVEGSVRKVGKQIRVTAQLSDAVTGKNQWSERFDRDQQDIFAVQDEIIGVIVGTLVGRLQAAGAEHARRKPPASLAAYECVLRGNALPFGDLEAEAEARRLFARAIALDPNYARAHALLALAEYHEWSAATAVSNDALDRAVASAKKAVALDENDSICQSVLGWILLVLRDFDLAERHYRRARDLNPNSPTDAASMGVLLGYLGRIDEAMACLDEAKRLDRFFDPAWYWHARGVVHFIARQYDEAIADFVHGPVVPLWVQAYLAACHAYTDRIDRAREYKTAILQSRPEFSIAQHLNVEPYKRQVDVDRLADGLRKAGLPE